VQRISNRKISQTFFIFFVLTVGIHKSNFIINEFTGLDIQSIIQISLLTFPLPFLFIAYRYSSSRKINTKKNKDSLMVNIIFFYVNILLFYGLIRGNNIDNIFFEYWTAVFLLLSHKIASSEEIWILFKGKLIIVFLIFSILVFLGTKYTLTHLVEIGYDALSTGGSTTGLMAYDMSPILDFWPFLFLLGFFNKKIKKFRFLIYLPFIIYLLFQVFFLKRAPTVRAISILVLASFIKMKLSINNYAFIKQIFVFITLGIVILSSTPEAIKERFNTKDTTRQDESLGMLSQLNPLEFVFGRGLGGYYNVHRGGIVQYTNNEGKDVSSIIHIGAAYPILKGGFLLFFLIFYHILKTVYISFMRIKKLTEEELSCLVFLIIYSVFRLIEGPFSLGAIFDALLFGMSLGYLNRNIKLQF
jgi:hypothetical protein